ncbi:helix-turn-helix transcriptional regulator [Intestinimonas butyriciproducens]|uniref:helix-turn-helix transcriptional regulator n=1 Tax=Intestinimonas butyriciproducens TaxID=1297617 RepID=UPI0018CF5ED2|nr:helix-turn-helix transcriptional regulator [Intestinimonas butyriciproducens]
MPNRVKEVRKEHGITQAQLAEKAKVCRPYLSAIESGKQKAISNIVMLKIANALNKPVSYIFFNDRVV